jgi:hypothetical protein
MAESRDVLGGCRRPLVISRLFIEHTSHLFVAVSSLLVLLLCVVTLCCYFGYRRPGLSDARAAGRQWQSHC